jgi:phosphoribosylaminoimidazole (AIR) synthetase
LTTRPPVELCVINGTYKISYFFRVLEKSGLSLNDQLPRNDGMITTVGEALMAPTVIYVKQVLEIINKGGVKGIAHITGGGFTDNIPRVFPSGLGAKIFTAAWEVPPVFRWIQEVRVNSPRACHVYSCNPSEVIRLCCTENHYSIVYLF